MKKSSVLFVLMAASGICFSSVYAQKRLVLDLNQTIAYSPVYRTCGNACIGGKVSV